MSTGIVAKYFEERGFGFIAPDGGEPQVFVHVSHVAGSAPLKNGQRVSFEVVTDARRGTPRADRVRVL